MSAGKLPLAGVRVLDFGHAAAGPFAAMFLGDLGAEVIKIERPGRGDGVRFFGKPLFDTPMYSDYFAALNRNKRSLLLDLRKPAAVDAARKLAANCDIVIENFRPGVLERLGLGFEDLKSSREGLIYGSISAFGDSGPWKERPANDIIMQAVSGLMSMTGEEDGGPVRVGGPVADYATGLVLVSAILAAMLVRGDHPEGQHIHIPMFDAVINLMGNFVPGLVGGNYDTIPRQGSKHAQIVPYQAFECAGGDYLMVGAFTEGFWVRLCKALGRPDLSLDPRYKTNTDRLENQAPLLPVLEKAFLEKSRDEWLQILADSDVPASAIYELGDALKSEQGQYNEIIRWIDDSKPGTGNRVGVVRSPIRNPAWPALPATYPPPMGRDSVSVLRESAGLTEEEIAQLVADGAVGVEAQ